MGDDEDEIEKGIQTLYSIRTLPSITKWCKRCLYGDPAQTGGVDDIGSETYILYYAYVSGQG